MQLSGFYIQHTYINLMLSEVLYLLCRSFASPRCIRGRCSGCRRRSAPRWWWHICPAHAHACRTSIFSTAAVARATLVTMVEHANRGEALFFGKLRGGQLTCGALAKAANAPHLKLGQPQFLLLQGTFAQSGNFIAEAPYHAVSARVVVLELACEMCTHVFCQRRCHRLVVKSPRFAHTMQSVHAARRNGVAGANKTRSSPGQRLMLAPWARKATL